MVQTGEISAIITKSTVRAYWFGERWMEFGIAIKTLHNSFHCAQLNPYGGQYHYEKQMPFCIHDKSILLLGHLGPFYGRIRDA
jgi:hypothetical protein